MLQHRVFIVLALCTFAPYVPVGALRGVPAAVLQADRGSVPASGSLQAPVHQVQFKHHRAVHAMCAPNSKQTSLVRVVIRAYRLHNKHGGLFCIVLCSITSNHRNVVCVLFMLCSAAHCSS